MGAGLSKEREYRIVYRQLHRIKHDLAKAGIETVYRNRQLVCSEHSPGDCNPGFNISYSRINASNGEAALFPSVYVSGFGTYGTLSKVGTYDEGIAKIKDLRNWSKIADMQGTGVIGK